MAVGLRPSGVAHADIDSIRRLRDTFQLGRFNAIERTATVGYIQPRTRPGCR